MKHPAIRAWAGAILASIALAACTEGATDDLGYGAAMRMDNAQFVPGSPPASQGGPTVESVDLLTNTIWPGYANKLVKGALGEGATSATLILRGDDGFWIVPAGAPDVSTPTLPSFTATVSFGTRLGPGNHTLEVRAVDAQGRFGRPGFAKLTALDGPPSTPVDGALIVSLAWDTEADLDLHVVDPAGDEIFHGAPSSENPFLMPGASTGNPGTLDLDSNAGCVIDGRRREEVTWAKDPPSGHYLIRVDTTSLCGEPMAHYRATVSLHGKPVGEVAGVALDPDTWGPHDRGAGLLALTFDVP